MEELRPDQRIGAYRIIRQLGAGGMGRVYEAEHVALGIRRALKVFDTKSEHAEFLRKRFVAEGRILADLQHPRIVRVYDLVVDDDSGLAYFEMDLVLSPSGLPRTLADEQRDGVSEEKVAGWFHDICEGLAYIHSQGVVHRDISLDNILIGSDGHAVITDFGVAKIIDDSYRKKIDVTVTMVFKDGIELRMGKGLYMAPELKKHNGKATFASDAYAVGVILFRLLSGSWYDVGTHLEDWLADFEYDWHPVISQLCNVDPKKRLGEGGIAAIPALLKHSIDLVNYNYAEELEYEFKTDKDTGRKTVTIVGARKATGDYKIPAEIDGCRVTHIRFLAFRGYNGFTSVTIPASVERIGFGAFMHCDVLMNVTIIGGVKIIGESAFAYCHRLTKVTMPDSVTSIGNSAFAYCHKLTNVTIPDSVESIGDSAFEGCNASIFDTTTIPGIKQVDGWVIGHTKAISGNPNLSGVRGIGSYAFNGCCGLANLTIPDSVKSIGECAFCGCTELVNVAISENVTEIGTGAFGGCVKLTGISVSSGNEKYLSKDELLLTKDSKCLIAVPGGLRSVTIPNGVTNIWKYAFCGCIWLERVSIPSSVLAIGDAAFCMCGVREFVVQAGNPSYKTASGLLLIKDGTMLIAGVNGDVVIPDGITSIGQESFRGYVELTSVRIPNSVTNIGHNAFRDCTELTSMTIPGSVENIGDSAFSGCTSLTSVVIGDGVKSIGKSAFSDCKGLGNVIVPNSVTNIGDSAFSGCTSLTSVVIGNGVKIIGETAFSDCKGLRNVIVPNSVMNIGDGAFYYCTGLSNFSVAENNLFYKSISGLLLTKDGKTLLQGVNGDVVIPDGVTDIEAFAFYGLRGLKSLVIPTSVVNIGIKAFEGTNVETVYVSVGDADRVKELIDGYGLFVGNIKFQETASSKTEFSNSSAMRRSWSTVKKKVKKNWNSIDWWSAMDSVVLWQTVAVLLITIGWVLLKLLLKAIHQWL